MAGRQSVGFVLRHALDLGGRSKEDSSLKSEGAKPGVAAAESGSTDTPAVAKPLVSLKALLNRSVETKVSGYRVKLNGPSTTQVSDLVTYRRRQAVRYEKLVSDLEKVTPEERERAWVDSELVNLEVEIAAKAVLLTIDPVHEIASETEARQFVLVSGGIGSDLCLKALSLCGLGVPPAEDGKEEVAEGDRPT